MYHWQEIKALWELSDQALGRPYKLALQLLLATCGQRPNELIAAPLSEFDLEARVWSIPTARTMKHSFHLVVHGAKHTLQPRFMQLPGLLF